MSLTASYILDGRSSKCHEETTHCGSLLSIQPGYVIVNIAKTKCEKNICNSDVKSFITDGVMARAIIGQEKGKEMVEKLGS